MRVRLCEIRDHPTPIIDRAGAHDMNESDAARVADVLEDVRRLFKEHASARGAFAALSLSTIMILREIAREPGVSVSALGRKTGLSKGYVSAVVDQMGGEGLVEKQPDTQDQRCVQIGLTNEGTELLSRLDLSYRGFWAELLLGVSDCDGARIVEGLECLCAALQQQRTRTSTA